MKLGTLLGLLAAGLILFISACATTVKTNSLTPEEKVYVSKVLKTEAQFEVGKEKAEEMWSRGFKFVQANSTVRIQSASDYHLQTYNPAILQNETGAIGYNLYKQIDGDKVKISIQCVYSSGIWFKYTESVCKNNEKVLSHYMQTGEIMQKFVDAKIHEDTEAL